MCPCQKRFNPAQARQGKGACVARFHREGHAAYGSGGTIISATSTGTECQGRALQGHQAGGRVHVWTLLQM
eukprot:4268063-Lingulodinium_polyedra.AAC.1